MYVRVYDHDNVAFDVTRERADRLILEEGWTQTKVEKSPVEEPSGEKTYEGSVFTRKRKS